MSDSDDTDVLLLIPPDYFVINSSDSEESFTIHSTVYEGCYHITNESRVDELVDQVNELEERINLIESRDNLNSEKYLSETSHFNQSFDCAVSVDSSKFHKLGRSDLALRFYSMSSTGYRFGGGSSDNVGIQFPGRSLQSTPVKAHQPISLPSSPSTVTVSSQNVTNVARHESDVDSTSVKHVLLEPVVSVGIRTVKDFLKPDPPNHSVVGKANHKDGGSGLSHEWQDTSFLNEIDEFLENRKKKSEEQFNLKPITSTVPSQNHKISSEKTPNVIHFGLPSFSNIPSNNALIRPKAISPLEMQPLLNRVQRMDLPQVDKLLNEMEATQMEIEEKLRSKELQLGRTTVSKNINQDGVHQNTTALGNNENSFLNHDFRIHKFIHGEPSSSSVLFEGQANNANRDQNKNNTDLPAVISQPDMDRRSDTNIIGQGNFTAANFNMDKQQSAFHNPNEVPHGDGSSNVQIENIKDNEHRKPSQYQGITNFSQQNLIQGSNQASHFYTGLGLKDLHINFPSQVESEEVLPSGIPLQKRSFLPQAQIVNNGQSGEMRTLYESQNKKRVDFALEDIGIQRTAQKSQSESTLPISKGMSMKIPRPVVLDDGRGSSTGTTSSTSNLLSLSELWGSDSRLARNEHMSLEQRLEEERYRRQHCEHLIHHLQSRLLEEQQRIAVAVRVDRGKDQAILQLQAAWSRLVSHWHELEEQRHYLASQLNAERTLHQKAVSEMGQKVKRYELELSKVLDLAQGYKEKCDNLEQSQQESEQQHVLVVQGLEMKLEEEHSKITKADENKEHMRCEMENLLERLRATEEEAHKERQIVLRAHEEASKSAKKLNTLEAQLMSLQEENSSLQLRLKEEKSRSSLLEQQKKDLQSALDESKKKEKSLRGELKEKGDLIEKVKLELRDYYQEQVEVVVREKLQEFQTQLDSAEVSLHKEMEERDKAATEAAVKQVQHINEKHQLEVKLLEEKHNEELQLYKLQLTQAAQQISQLQTRLQGYNHRKTEIVEKLHGVMEAQWQEALRIISGNSPLVHPAPPLVSKERDKGDCSSNMWPLQTPSNSHSNISKLKNVTTAFHVTNSYNVPVRDNEEQVPPLHIPDSSGGSSAAEEMPFSKEGQQTCRVNEEEELQKYIRMLLNRYPGNPISCSNIPSGIENHDSKRRPQCNWEKVEDLQQSMASFTSNSAFDVSKVSSKDGRSGKPPWK